MANVNDLTNPNNWISVEALNDYHEKTKDEIDGLLDEKQSVFQFDTMPTASADNVGDIVQFIGTTTGSYTNGYFYKCVENSGSYSWVQTDVQPSSGGGGASESEIAPVEATSTASKAYAVGDLFIYDGKLYRVTSAIASGGTITPGTNCVETSVSEVFVRKTGDTMSGALTIGDRLGTVGTKSLAQGSSVVASGAYSSAFGNRTTATGDYAHAEGWFSSAGGQNSHAEGYYTSANNMSTHAEGEHTIVGYAYQHVQGKYNDNKSVNAFEIGNGTADDARSNALEVTWDGDLTAAGEITDGQGNTLKGTNSNLAPIEPTTTASQAYGAGDYLVYGGQLYKVTTAITSGGTIVVTGSGANVVATTVVENLGGGSSLPSGGTTGQVLSKHSDTDGDVEWKTPDVPSIDISEETVAFTSGDSSDASATSWTSVSTVTSDSTLATILNRVTSMMKNVRFLNKKFSIKSYSGSNVLSSLDSPDTNHNIYVSSNSFVYGYKYGDIKIVNVSIQLRQTMGAFGFYANSVGTLANEFKPSTNPSVTSVYNISGFSSVEGMTTGQAPSSASGQQSLISEMCIYVSNNANTLSLSIHNASNQAITNTSSLLCTVWCMYI